MKITFLGTGTSQGVPVIACDCEVCKSLDHKDKRLRTSVHIETADSSIVIDTGPDFRSQILRERINHLDAILFTHQHKDHTAGLDDVRSFNFKQQTDMPIYGTVDVLEQIRNEFSYAFSEKKYPGTPNIATREINSNPFLFRKLNIIPLPVMHHKLPILGFRIGDFSYITDANYIPDSTIDKIRGSRVLVLNALRIEEHISHFNLQQALEMAERIGSEKTYFTHISHLLGLHKEVDSKLPDGVSLAWDGLKISV